MILDVGFLGKLCSQISIILEFVIYYIKYITFFKYTRIIIYPMEQELAALTGPRLAVVPELVEAAPGIHPGQIDLL